MKKLSHLFLVFLVSVVVFSCSKKEDPPEPTEDTSLPTISNLSKDIASPTPGQAVVISATVTTPETAPITTVVLKWKVNNGGMSNVSMSNKGNNVYSGTIPAQSEEGVTVNYTVLATNKNGTKEESGSYVVSEIPLDYSKLVLNEINGNGIPFDKYIELYNNSTRAIPLHGVTIFYNNFASEPKKTWTGTDQVIQAGSFLLLKGAEETGALKTELSATEGIVVEMFDPDENSIDFFAIGPDDYRDNSYSRLPNGTGKWYLTFSGGTPGTTNSGSYNDLIPTSPFILGFTRDVEIPTASDAVTVSATVRACSGTSISSVVLKWTRNGAAPSTIAMTNVGNLYSATIPAQATGSFIDYTLTATNDVSEIAEVSSGYYVMPEGGIDYTKIKLNEVSGVGEDCEKFYELINIGDIDIPLANCRIYYNANSSTGGAFPPDGNQGLTWNGNASQVIKAGEMFCLIGRNGGTCLNPTTPNSFTTGLTAQRKLIITLTDPDGITIDECIRAEDAGDYSISNKSFSRIPDGSGEFYFTTPTPCATNGKSTEGLLLVPKTPVTVEPPDDVDYSGLKLNEVSGVGVDSEKFYELINLGTEDIPLTGCKIYYNANGSEGGTLPSGKGSLTWTGLSTQTIEAGKLFSLIGRNTPGSFTTGLTASRILIITLEDPAGNIIDQCIRAEDTKEYAITDKSFSRIPDGTGLFYFTTPTPNLLNGGDATGLTLVPKTQGGTPDFTNLKINEVNGVSGQKWVEIYNTGSEAIPLNGATINYSNNAGSSFTVQYTFSADDVIEANGFFSNSTALGSCSANNANVIITLKSPSGAVLDTYTKLLDINTGKGFDQLTDKAHARIPDGTGDWYYTADGVGTRNATNGASTEGLTKIGEESGEVGGFDYTKLKINEVNGVDKWFEIYNTGDVEINLQGVTAHYSNSEPANYNTTNTWTGTSSQTIPAKGWFSTKGITLGTGLSANNINVRLQLRDPDGTVLDTYEKLLNVNPGEGYDHLTNKSHARIPDGTGSWYYIADGIGTSGATNSTSTAGLTKFGEEIKDEPSLDDDYTGLVLNEICGEQKFVEIYNSSDEDISLSGVKLQRNDGASQWVGGESDIIPAGAYRIFLFNSFTAGLDTNPAYVGWTVNSGISDQQTLKIALVTPSGNTIDVFMRGNTPWGTGGAERETTYSYSRMSDDTWAYAAPTPGVENGTYVKDIVNPGYSK